MAADAGNLRRRHRGILFQPSRGSGRAAWGTPTKLFAFKDHAWRGIFWVSLPPGILFVIGSFMVAESPRWLLRRGKKEAAHAALLRSRTPAQADLELKEMLEDRGRREKQVARSRATKAFFAASTSSRSFWPASFLPAIRLPASIRSSPTTRRFFCRAASPTTLRIWDTSCSRWLTSW